VRALVGTHAGPLHVDAEAHADVVACGPRTQQAQALFQEPRVIAAVVDGPAAVLPGEAGVVRELVRLDEVPAPHLGGIERGIGREHVDRALDRPNEALFIQLAAPKIPDRWQPYLGRFSKAGAAA